jgi:hypothetical protein
MQATVSHHQHGNIESARSKVSSSIRQQQTHPCNSCGWYSCCCIYRGWCAVRGAARSLRPRPSCSAIASHHGQAMAKCYEVCSMPVCAMRALLQHQSHCCLVFFALHAALAHAVHCNPNHVSAELELFGD